MQSALNLKSNLQPDFTIQMKDLFHKINLKYDYDFCHYTPASMRRRLTQAMNHIGSDQLLDLQKKILNDPHQFYNLLQFLTVSVTEMFRDPAYFLSLRQHVIPILRTYPSLKIWIAGCSTGEEVYSLAILLQEENLLDRTILYATDINPRNLEIATSGLFDMKKNEESAKNYELAGGSKKFSDYYTTIVKNNVNVTGFNTDLVEKITFSDHSLTTDAVFSEMQFISCRNVLIYFSAELQDQTIGLFHESLCRKGFLGLGPKETIQFTHSAKHFKSFVKKERIYQKI